MAKIRITKEFTFEMAHALWNYDGACRNTHGHSYRLIVTVIGEPLNEPENPKHGMVMDFSELKKIVHQTIIKQLDHAFMVGGNAPVKLLKSLPQLFDRFVVTDYQPSCENMLLDFAERIKSRLPKQVELHSLRLHETANSYAEWYASDND